MRFPFAARRKRGRLSCVALTNQLLQNELQKSSAQKSCLKNGTPYARTSGGGGIRSHANRRQKLAAPAASSPKKARFSSAKKALYTLIITCKQMSGKTDTNSPRTPSTSACKKAARAKIKFSKSIFVDGIFIGLIGKRPRFQAPAKKVRQKRAPTRGPFLAEERITSALKTAGLKATLKAPPAQFAAECSSAPISATGCPPYR